MVVGITITFELYCLAYSAKYKLPAITWCDNEIIFGVFEGSFNHLNILFPSEISIFQIASSKSKITLAPDFANIFSKRIEGVINASR